MNRKRIRWVGAAGIGLCLCALTYAYGISAEPKTREVIEVQVRDEIKAVYQIKTDEWKEGVGAGLHYLQKIMDAYQSMGIEPSHIRLHGVFHGEAGYWLLKDEAYRRASKQEGENPNKRIIQELTKAGVSIELCRQTMKSNGWKEEEVLPEVKLVIGAYPRVIDLQLQGYAYIRF